MFDKMKIYFACIFYGRLVERYFQMIDMSLDCKAAQM